MIIIYIFGILKTVKERTSQQGLTPK